jgi:hypothetical protein
MTCTVTATNGIGASVGRIAALDHVSAVSVSGLAAGFHGVAVTGRLTTGDGKTALSDDATATVSGTGTLALQFNCDTAAMLALMPAGKAGDTTILLTVWTAAFATVCISRLRLTPY